MTNEERQQAIEWLKSRPITMPGAKKMFALAVEALEAYVPDMNVEDMISRQAVIDAIKGEIEINGYSHVVDVLKQLPSAEPERKTGRWIDGSIPTYAACSECGYPERYADENNYCPNCGARMMRDKL